MVLVLVLAKTGNRSAEIVNKKLKYILDLQLGLEEGEGSVCEIA